MKVELKIENDADLRSYIKNCIKGQVLSVVREDFREMVKNELERKVNDVGEANFTKMFKVALKEAISEILYREHDVSEWRGSFIKPHADAIVINALQSMDHNRIIADVVKEKLNNILLNKYFKDLANEL